MAAAAALSQNNHAYADGPFNFASLPGFPSSSNVPQSSSSDSRLPPTANLPNDSSPPPQPKVRNDQPRTTSAGFDPEALERGVKALKEITTSPHGKKVWELSLLIVDEVMLALLYHIHYFILSFDFGMYLRSHNFHVKSSYSCFLLVAFWIFFFLFKNNGWACRSSGMWLGFMGERHGLSLLVIKKTMSARNPPGFLFLFPLVCHVFANWILYECEHVLSCVSVLASNILGNDLCLGNCMVKKRTIRTN